MSNGGTFRRPAVPPPVRIRRDVFNLASNDPIIVFYEKAIGVMKQGGLDDPLSWRYQAAVHDYPFDANTNKVDVRDPPPPPPAPAPPNSGRTGDPNAVAKEKFPGDQDKFWRQCQHSSWFFLSWHRIYLHHFEKIIMNIVEKTLKGPSDWALPYWNYSRSPAAALLPAPFRVRTSNLFVRERTQKANDGLPFLDLFRSGPSFGKPDPSKPDTNLNCLKAKSFKDDFAGPTGSEHFSGAGGAVENAPHDFVHSAFGDSSFMIRPGKAPLDPIFYLHHCNIDRLWEVWVQRQKQLLRLSRDPRDSDPPDPNPDPDRTSKAFLDTPFPFHDGTDPTGKGDGTMTSRQVLNTRLPPLSYEYEDTSDPDPPKP